MVWQEGKRRKGAGRPIPNALQNRQILDAMKAADVAAIPENKDKVIEAIAGRKLTNKEVLDLVKSLFSA